MDVSILQLLYYDRTDAFERINVNKTSKSKQGDIWHYWFLLYKGSKFQPNACNRCQNLLMMSVDHKLNGEF